MEAYKVVNEAIRKLETRMKKCKESPANERAYNMGVEHAIRFIKIELKDALQKDGE